MFKTGDNVTLSEEAITYFSRDNWTKYRVPYLIYKEGGVVTAVSNSYDEIRFYVRAKGEESGEVFFHEKDLIKIGYATRASNSSSALDKQISGDHYKSCGIQPIEYIHANGLDYFEGNAVKYITRHRKKNGKADIEKAIHYLELLLEMEYKEDVTE